MCGYNSKEMASMIRCSICNAEFDGTDEFTKHLTNEHDMGSSPHVARYLAFLERRIRSLEYSSKT